MRTVTDKMPKHNSVQPKSDFFQNSTLVDIGFMKPKRLSSVSSSTDSDSEPISPLPSRFDYEDTKACSDDDLIAQCVDCFDTEGNCLNDRLPRILFHAHSWFITSEQLTLLFTKLFENESTTREVRQKTLHAVRFWMNNFPHIFDLDAELVSAIKNLQKISIEKDNVQSNLLDIRSRGMYEWMRQDQMSHRPTHLRRKNHKVSLVFHHLEPEEIAIHMSYLEYKCFRRLTMEDFHKYAKNATIKENPKLERAVILFNNITHWVQCMVLGQKSAQGRATIVVKYINIAKYKNPIGVKTPPVTELWKEIVSPSASSPQPTPIIKYCKEVLTMFQCQGLVFWDDIAKLHEMRNYNTLVAVVGALTHTAIARLKQTSACLPKDSVKDLQEIVKILDSKKNYSAYRQDYARGSFGFKIPIVGVLMKDLIGLHVAMPDRNEDGFLNMKKMAVLAGIFKELSSLQKMQYPMDVNRDLVNTMRVSLYLYYSEEEIYRLSLEREPRDPKLSTSGPSSPHTNNMVFAEFAKYTCQLDRESVRMHVTAMVESVFKAYDHDGDGCISEEEFENFNSNFPGMDSFADMDQDKDGRISNAEMLDYFLKASSARRNEFCQSFKHDFVETTFHVFTYCEECDKLLWGLIKQGWKCRSCGINCHKHCKDRIVQECRVKDIRNGVDANQNGHRKSSENSNSKRKDFKRLRDMSVSSETDIKPNNNNNIFIRRVASSPKCKHK